VLLDVFEEELAGEEVGHGLMQVQALNIFHDVASHPERICDGVEIAWLVVYVAQNGLAIQEYLCKAIKQLFPLQALASTPTQ